MVETIRWDGKYLWVLDQTKLPFEITYRKCANVESVADTIKSMQVRGAPAIGVTAAYGMVLASRAAAAASQTIEEFSNLMENYSNLLASTRPTAVNLFWAIEKMKSCINFADFGASPAIMEIQANEIFHADVASCKSIGRFGGSLLPAEGTVLTHCNAGALATAGYGTALGVIRGAIEMGKKIRVFADETRPFLQGARLTAWELLQDDIETILITDNMAAHFMARGEIDAVVVGADRIAANGDTANKIGTYSVALAASAHQIPFYVAAPVSTIDTSIEDGSKIPIEERSPDEVTHLFGSAIAALGVGVRNPAFDVTPHRLITAIITEKGVIKPPFFEGIRNVTSSV